MTYEQALHTWAAGKLGIAADEVVSVEFAVDVRIWDTAYDYSPEAEVVTAGNPIRKTIAGIDFGETVREIVALAQLEKGTS